MLIHNNEAENKVNVFNGYVQSWTGQFGMTKHA